MIFPKFLKKDDVIGITASSCGVLDGIKEYELALNNFSKYGFLTIETSNVRTDGVVSSNALQRVNELQSLYENENVKLVQIASGGDFLYDMLHLVNYDIIRNNVKWISGSSDPSSLLFIITTNLDIATIYSPCNVKGFGMPILHESLVNYMKIITGENVKQEKFNFYEKDKDKMVNGYNLTSLNNWLNINGDVCETGILIGGCIDCLKDVIGTCFDKTKEFIERYKHQGIIWYFDVFSMSCEQLYITLLQFKNAGWFKYCKAILIGKVKFPNSFNNLQYEDLIRKAVQMPCIFNFDIGHVKPSFTMINGALVKVVSNDKEGSLEFL